MEPRQREQLQPDRGRGLHYGWLILVTCALLNGVSIGLARFGFGTILPAMQQSMGFNHEQTGFIASADLFGY
ncbi:MAG: YbfB/YjiJ family MFS transporter, partial [Firmicutes bacterium]|nr:YbfB/YjiJ family MFS transporter [Bacillota bacterium]